MGGKTNKKTARAAATTNAKSTAQPKLVAGGNPQIAKGDGDAPVQAYLAAMPGWKSAVGRQLDALVTRNAPNVRKAVKWNSPFFGIDGQGWFLSFHCYTKYIKVAFFRGTSLSYAPKGPGATAACSRGADQRGAGSSSGLDRARRAAASPYVIRWSLSRLVDSPAPTGTPMVITACSPISASWRSRKTASMRSIISSLVAAGDTMRQPPTLRTARPRAARRV